MPWQLLLSQALLAYADFMLSRLSFAQGDDRLYSDDARDVVPYFIEDHLLAPLDMPSIAISLSLF